MTVKQWLPFFKKYILLQSHSALTKQCLSPGWWIEYVVVYHSHSHVASTSSFSWFKRSSFTSLSCQSCNLQDTKDWITTRSSSKQTKQSKTKLKMFRLYSRKEVKIDVSPRIHVSKLMSKLKLFTHHLHKMILNLHWLRSLQKQNKKTPQSQYMVCPFWAPVKLVYWTWEHARTKTIPHCWLFNFKAMLSSAYSQVT